MAKIKPFKAIRPRKDLAAKIAALPYDTVSSKEAREITKNNPYSFLHIDRAEIDLPEDIDVYNKKVYEKARDNLNQMIDNKEFIQDSRENFYIYRQIMNGRSQTGLVICASVDDYINNVIKKHEFTRKDKEIDRINHVDYCNANTGPIFLTYRENEEISKIIDEWTLKTPEYDFKSEDGVSQIVWVVDDDKTIKRLEELFSNIDSLYIADGHHRSASAVEVSKMRRKENPEFTGEEEFNYFLAVAFRDRDLYVMDYNRVVKDLGEFTEEEFLKEVSKDFEISLYDGEGGYKPNKKHTFGMYLNNKWYILKAKDGSFNENHPIYRLDVSILQENLLKKILKIGDIRTSDRIDFIGGIRGINELELRVNKGMKLAFSMYPTEIQDVMDVADIGEVMPPKSTWFEPKLRSGLFIHKLE
ncbi:hypothetical protein BH721_12250 [Clostridium baratii]|uniref:SpoOJ/ParA/ParB/repB family protein n=1 Tax=Clostridium baratii TaxID=1561 RepID=A0A174V1W7_9CLOT|nr:DUF1015 family protein [Clostridium baratii]OPF50893.1 hypothetical protein A1M12_06370 [Clostridium baratii]OPF55000.1 hypothetical protein BH724_13790 [Clostridium baratii]OPF57261.1 hypothetical protein BH721_12250 [Clostridium baratii]OPF59216.1 hypothetical protein BH725_09060 [Clostridium baratii]CUQ28763.1 SpoOJ/ParA/ParB/repB family protein [Clostridium baratii]